jgi:hypothetical protein
MSKKPDSGELRDSRKIALPAAFNISSDKSIWENLLICQN